MAGSVAILKLWFVSAQGIVGLPGSSLDDQLFLTLADHIAHGRWLGPYDLMTLAKGCGYPLFIAAAFLLGLPLTLAQAGLYVVSCWLVIRALRPLLPSDGFALAFFALLCWQPMSYWVDNDGGNVLRQNIYTPLVLCVFAGLAGIYTRRAVEDRRVIAWSVVLGGGFGWLWITREESVWILPSVILLLVVLTMVSWQAGARRWRIILPISVACVCAVAPAFSVSLLNARYYGWFGTVEFRSRDFIAAYASFNRAKPTVFIEHVPVPRETRLRLYDVSPAFAELRPFLEGEPCVNWVGPSLEFSGAIWMWALRAAVAHAGYTKTPTDALAYYRRLAEEVNRACDVGLIEALPRRDSLFPTLNKTHWASLREQAWPLFRSFVWFERFNARVRRSFGNADELLLFRDMTHSFVTPSPSALVLDIPRTRKNFAWRIGALQDAGLFLRKVCITTIAIGLVAWLISGVQRLLNRSAPGYLWWYASSALGGALAVWVIALLVNVTSWYDPRPLRFHQGYPLLLIFAGCAIAHLYQTKKRAAPST